MNNEINYEIDNCITDLDTLKVLDKRAMKDLENNTHEIEQQEVLTIIREFIRLRNDYNKEKEKNRVSINSINDLMKECNQENKRCTELAIELDKEKEKNKELENADLTTIYMNGFYDGEKKWKDKINKKAKELNEKKFFKSEAYILQKLLEERN